ncbi:MAG: DUF3463 domain-containing protein [Planctomycetaceae bacterium]
MRKNTIRQFSARRETISLFQRIFARTAPAWRFNQSPLFLEFLKGRWDLECTPWGNPTFNLFGWQKPCYLVDEGYASTFQELMQQTPWENYGRASGNPKCARRWSTRAMKRPPNPTDLHQLASIHRKAASWSCSGPATPRPVPETPLLQLEIHKSPSHPEPADLVELNVS